MTALIATVLGASLLGSAHCAGMCGGFVAFYAGGAASLRGRAAWWCHLAYNGGRLAAYAVLGGAAGLLGAALDTTGGALLGVQRTTAIVSGVLITLWGVHTLLEALGVRTVRLGAPRALRSLAGRGLGAVADAPPLLRALAVGVATGLLPCGWLYAFLVTAAGTGSALRGVALMAVFWIGTVPGMLSVGVGLQSLAGPLRRHIPVVCATAMIVVGLLAVGGRLHAVDPGVGAAEHAGHAHH
jgi:sulfite exporter TauE/SafE